MGRAVETKNEYPDDWHDIATATKAEADGCCIRCSRPHNPGAGYCLTVHHLDGNKANCAWWNLPALCQRCHLTIQARVNPDQDIFPFLELSEWIKPYIAGRRAAAADLPDDRATVMARLDEYLAL